MHRGWDFKDVSSVLLQNTFDAAAVFIGQFTRKGRYTSREVAEENK
jgi:hypothetical protein